jgi:hypothetical protein
MLILKRRSDCTPGFTDCLINSTQGPEQRRQTAARAGPSVFLCRESCACVPMSSSGARPTEPGRPPGGGRGRASKQQVSRGGGAESEDCDKLVRRPRRQTGETSPDLLGFGRHVRRVPT